MRSATILAIVLAGIGVAWLSLLSPNHSECSSALVAAANAAACRADNLRWYLALALVGAGVLVGIYAAVRHATRDEAPTARFCSKCGAALEESAKFCSQCGQVREA